MSNLNEKPTVNVKCLEDVYDIRQKIGDGHFADVNLCICRKSQKAYAAKFIMKQRLSSAKTYGNQPQGTSIADIDREAFILTNLKHDNIVKLHEVFHRDDSVVLILDLVTGGELFARVAECERLSEEEASNFVEQILLGVQHMHSLGIVHLDLKPENIMIEDLASRKIKIIDFGLARVLNPNETFQDMAGTPEFCAPEIVTFDPITFATDMWAIGVITYILLSGISPFAGDSQIETFQNIVDCVVDYTRDEIKEATEMAKDFIQHLLIKNPRKRSTVTQCLQHPWIKPCDSVQTSYRRGSLIRKQNLDGLRQFIAYPSPPSSPAGFGSGTSNEAGKFFTVDDSASPSCHTPLTETKPLCGSNMLFDTIVPESPDPNAAFKKGNNFMDEKPHELNQSEIRNDKVSTLSTSSSSENEAINNRKTSPSSTKKGSVQKRGNFRSGLIERLGAAISNATIHSTNQNTSESITIKRAHQVKGSNHLNLESSDFADQLANSTHAEGSGKYVRRVWQFGVVSRPSRELETAAVVQTTSTDLVGNRNEPEDGDQSKSRRKMHSVTSSGEFKAWNKSKRESYSDWPHKEPDRVHVGRLQQFFESGLSSHGRSRNGVPRAHRFSHA